jgi:hypothetical protein
MGTPTRRSSTTKVSRKRCAWPLLTSASSDSLLKRFSSYRLSLPASTSHPKRNNCWPPSGFLQGPAKQNPDRTLLTGTLEAMCCALVFGIVLAAAAAGWAQTPDAAGLAGWLISGPGGSLNVTRVTMNEYRVTVCGSVSLRISAYVQCRSNSCAQGTQYSITETDSNGHFPSTGAVTLGVLCPGL